MITMHEVPKVISTLVPVGFKLPSLHPIESTKMFTMFYNENRKHMVVTVLNNYDYLSDSVSHGSLHVFNSSSEGEKLFPPLLLPSAASRVAVTLCLW